MWYPSLVRKLRNCVALRRSAFVLTGKSNITKILISLFILMQLQRDQLRQFQQILPRCNAIGQSRTHPVNRQHAPVSSARLLYEIIGEIEKPRFLPRSQHIIVFGEILRHIEIDNGAA